MSELYAVYGSVTPDVWEKLQEIREKRGFKLTSHIVRRAVEHYVRERYPRKTKTRRLDSFREEMRKLGRTRE